MVMERDEYDKHIGDAVAPDVAISSDLVIPDQGKVKWSEEVERRGRHILNLLGEETAKPTKNEPWRMELIKRAKFTIWLDERAVARSRRGVNSNSDIQ